jgi:acetyltransferase-like isoleucine patch superfamily enzyme
MAYLSEEQLAAMGFKRLGRNVRISDKASIYDADRIEIGDNSRIDDFCVVSGKISIGRNIHVTIFCNLAGGSEGIVIEDFSTLAYGCQVFTQSDDYSGRTMTNSTVPARYKAETKAAVHIGRHCIAGTNAVIFPGVTMAEGCSLGAMSLLTRTTEPWSIYVGVPARKIKERHKDLLEMERDYLANE